MVVAVAEVRPIRDEIDWQRKHDARRAFDDERLATRVHAVREARTAVDRGELGSEFALRQSLIALASACESMAEGMHAPVPQA